MSRIFKQIMTVDEEPTVRSKDYITSEGVLYFGDVWAKDGDYATIPKWWLKEVSLLDLLDDGSLLLGRDELQRLLKQISI